MTESERMEEANEDSALLSTPKKIETPTGPQCRLPAHTVVLGLLAVVAVTALTTVNVVKNTESSLSSDEFSIAVVDPDYPKPSSVTRGLYPWDAVYAPHREHDLSFVGASSSAKVTWTVSQQIKGGAAYTDGASSSSSFETLSTWTSSGPKAPAVVLAKEAGRNCKLTASDELGHTATHEFITKHVRREIRALSDTDRDEFLVATAAVMATPTKEGQVKYGEDFLGGEWFTRWHMTAQKPSGALHSPWHNMPSFFTVHAAFTDVFERSMQAVHGKTAAHYWDFSIDAAYDDWTTSEIWSDKFFGTGTTDTKYEVSGTYWENITHSVVEEGESGSGRLHNSYGIETMPYNNNPSMKVARAQSVCGLKTGTLKLPGCAEVTRALNSTQKNDLQAFNNNVEGLIHGDLHGMLGGFWSCALDVQELITATPTLTEPMTAFIRDLNNYMTMDYYDGSITCPDSCDIAETDFADCTCSCPDEDPANYLETSERFSKLVGSKTSEMSTPHTFKLLQQDEATGKFSYAGLSEDENEQVLEAQVALLCSPPKLGDFATPYSAAFDPIFFPVHVNNERYWTYYRLAVNDPEFISFDKGWAAATWDSSQTDDDTFLGYDFDDPMKPFDNAYGNTREPAGTYYTNQELMVLFSPVNEELPYIFDDLSWSHCDSGL